jgi:hypothetical protein
LAHFGVPKLDAGWIYVVAAGPLLKVGRTKRPDRRLAGEAKTWLPDLEVIGVKPFWNVRRLEYSLHSALAEHWYKGEWHKFEDGYWRDFFVEAFSEFSDKDRHMNSVNFAYWMNRTNHAEVVGMQCGTGLSLQTWQACRGDPWRDLRQVGAHAEMG